MARREIRARGFIGYPAVAIGLVLVVFGVAVMIANDVHPLLILGWAAIGVSISGFHLASRLGYGPRLVRRERLR